MSPALQVPRRGASFRGLRVLHPFPSLVNALLVAAIASIAGGSLATSAVLAVAMLSIQFCIGATNDVVDERADRVDRPEKPLVRGDLSRRTASAAAVGLGLAGVALAATQGAVEAGLLAAMLGAGLAYDFGLKRLGLGWMAYAVAFPLLPAYAWFGAVGAWPPRYEILVPVAALAGPALALANGIVDHERDRVAGERTLVARLGRGRSLTAMGGLLIAIHALAWLTVATARVEVLAAMALASSVAAVGVGLSASPRAATRELGWKAQAVAIALLAAAWFVGAVISG